MTIEDSTHMQIDDSCAVNKISVDGCQMLNDLKGDCKKSLDDEVFNHLDKVDSKYFKFFNWSIRNIKGFLKCYSGCLFYYNHAMKSGNVYIEETVTLFNNHLSHLPIDSNTTNLIVTDCVKYGEV